MIRYSTRAPGRKGRTGDTDSVSAYAVLADCDRFAGLHQRSLAPFGLTQDRLRQAHDERLLMVLV